MFLIDTNVLDLAVWQAILLSLASLAFGWIVYDQICKRFVASNQTLVMIALVQDVLDHGGQDGPAH